MLSIKRCAANPILRPDPGLWWAGRQTRNPGVILDNGVFHMLFTAMPEPKNGAIYLGHATSNDGIHFEVEPEPFLSPSENFNDFDHGTVEDCRITAMDGKFYCAYAARSFNGQKYARGERRLGPDGNRNPTWTENFRRVGFAETSDWKSVKRLGPLTSEHLNDSNVVLLPEKINGKYAVLHRPNATTAWTLPMFYDPGSIWMAFTDDLSHWSSNRKEMPWNMIDGEDIPDDHLLIRPEFPWERLKIGASGVPIPTDDGLLMFYHAVDRQGTYREGLMLLDRENPLQVIARSPVPVMEPETELEKSGDYPNCIFPTANVVVGDEICMYYGAADCYTCLAVLNLKETLDYIKQFAKKEK